MVSGEARRFLHDRRNDPLYPAFVLLLLYGLRRGEVLGLSWDDVDLDEDELRVRRQIQRLDGELRRARSRPPPAAANCH